MRELFRYGRILGSRRPLFSCLLQCLRLLLLACICIRACAAFYGRANRFGPFFFFRKRNAQERKTGRSKVRRKKENTQSSNIERTCAHAHRHQTSSSPTRQKRNAAKRKVKSKARSEQSSEPIRRLSSPECGSATRFPFCAASLCR